MNKKKIKFFFIIIFFVLIANSNSFENKILLDKLKLKKYNPNTRKYEFFVEKKLPPHSK